VGNTEIVRKFAANVCGILSDETATGLCKVVMELDKLGDARDLPALLRVATTDLDRRSHLS
jgi:hypothetical protein